VISEQTPEYEYVSSCKTSAGSLLSIRFITVGT
jgi:hypothetical protein